MQYSRFGQRTACLCSVANVICAFILMICAGEVRSVFAQSPLNETQAQVSTLQTKKITIGSGHTVTLQNDPGSTFGDRSSCPPISQTLANYDFDVQLPGVQIVLQAGMAQGEQAAATYQLTANDFPLEVNQIDVIVGSVATIDTIMQWRIRVWEGLPTTGELVYDVISGPLPQDDPNYDPVDVPAIKVPAALGGNQASVIQLQFSVEFTADPADRIFINNHTNANAFTVAFQIVKHHNQIGSGCSASDVPSNSNCFPATEAGSCCNVQLTYPTQNWLYAIDCGGLACPAGWSRFSALQAGICLSGTCFDGCRPSGDWLLRAIWTKDPCDPSQVGACCLPTGACVANISGAECAAQNGDFQGQGVTCQEAICPQPLGKCCIAFDGSCDLVTQAECLGGTWTAGQTCSTACPVPVGACCNQSGGCANSVTRTQCQNLGGYFAGGGTVCGTGNTCPTGACCMPDGFCIGSISGPQCAAQGGAFQGVGTLCASVNCPQPPGACCTTTGSCEIVDEALCIFFGGTWLGGATTCDPFPCDITGACCVGTHCSAMTYANCSYAGGTYLGDYTGCLGDISNPITCCIANFDQINGVKVADIFAFLNAWFSQFNTCTFGCSADVDNSGSVTVSDIFVFLNRWFVGCN